MQIQYRHKTKPGRTATVRSKNSERIVYDVYEMAKVEGHINAERVGVRSGCATTPKFFYSQWSPVQ